MSMIGLSSAHIVSGPAINYHYFVMLVPFSEPVPLLPGMAAIVSHVAQPADSPPPERFLHFHAAAELVLINAGSGHLIGEGASCAFSAGAAVYIPAMAIHDFAFAPGARAWTLVQFDPQVVAPELVRLPSQPGSTGLEPAAFARAQALADWLGESVATQQPGRAIALQLQALMLAVAPVLPATNGDGARGHSAMARFRPVLDRLLHDPAHTLTLGEAASLCGVSPAYFSRRFTGVFGTGFSHYQMTLKLQQAARMLAASDEPISQVAYRLGFRSHAYFSHCFKAVFGVTPFQQRKGLPHLPELKDHQISGPIPS